MPVCPNVRGLRGNSGRKQRILTGNRTFVGREAEKCGGPSFVSLGTGRGVDPIRMTGKVAGTCLEICGLSCPAGWHPLTRPAPAGKCAGSGPPSPARGEGRRTTLWGEGWGLHETGRSLCPRRGLVNQSLSRCTDHRLRGEAIHQSSDGAVTHYPGSVIGGFDTMDEGNCVARGEGRPACLFRARRVAWREFRIITCQVTAQTRM